MPGKRSVVSSPEGWSPAAVSAYPGKVLSAPLRVR